MEISDRSLTILLFIIGTAITILLGYKEEIRNRFRTWDKVSLEKVIDKLKTPEYAEQQRYLRDKYVLLGLAMLTFMTALQTVVFTAVVAAYTSGEKHVSGPALFQFGGVYIALISFLNAYSFHRRSNSNDIKSRIDRLTNTYENKYGKLQP